MPSCPPTIVKQFTVTGDGGDLHMSCNRCDWSITVAAGPASVLLGEARAHWRERHQGELSNKPKSGNS